jgi:hypothetical protein
MPAQALNVTSSEPTNPSLNDFESIGDCTRGVFAEKSTAYLAWEPQAVDLDVAPAPLQFLPNHAEK